MNTSGWNRARALFDEVLELSPDERTAYLDARCADAPDVRARVEELLAADAEESGLLDGDAGTLVALPTEVSGPALGSRIGPFVLGRVIASGGMGMVFEAEQERPRRKVALKTLRAGFWTPDQVRRFRTEVDVLGMLQHPGIAQIHEAGTHEEGGVALPYFAMELVLGARTIREHAEDEELPLRARLRLFLEVCDAVHYGHTKGVIHRDLKPGNVLVDRAGRVKLIDFGLARVVDPDASSLSLSMAHTQTGHVLGTLPYMSPEHLSGSSFEVDVQSDVYSLACVLHELLTGRTPIDTTGLSLPAMLVRIERGDPEISAELPRDLRWILVRALEHSPRRRYDSVPALAADLERFLRHETVSVGAPSTTYRVLRFARRNRTALAFVGAIILALSLGLVRANRAYARESEALGKERIALQKESAALAKERAARIKESEALAKERTAREKAESERQMMEKVSFVLEFFVAALNPVTGGRDATIVDVIEQEVVPKLPYTRDPRVEAYLKAWIGQAYLNLREFEQADAYLAEAWAQSQVHFGPESAYRVQAAAIYADLLERTGRVRESAQLTEEVLPIAERVFGEFHNRSNYLRYNLAICARRLGEPARTEELLRKSLGYYERDAPEGSAVTVRKDIGSAILAQGRLDDASAWYEDTLRYAATHYGPESVVHATVGMELASVRLAMGRAAEAEELLLDAEPILVAGSNSPQNLYAVTGLLTWARLRQGALDEAEETLGLLATIVASGFDSGEPQVTLAAARADLARRRGQEDAEALARDAFELATELLPAQHENRVEAGRILARVYLDQGSWDLADERLAALERNLAEHYGREDPRLWPVLRMRVEALRGAGRDGEADALERRIGE